MELEEPYADMFLLSALTVITKHKLDAKHGIMEDSVTYKSMTSEHIIWIMIESQGTKMGSKLLFFYVDSWKRKNNDIGTLIRKLNINL